MHDQHLIGRMRALKAEMLSVADNLRERGNLKQSDELTGAAEILQTWIKGIRGDQRNERVEAAARTLAPVESSEN